MGGADFINVLFSEYLVYDPKNPEWEGRDRYFQDPGHMSPMLYSALALTGKFTMEELSQFRQWGSPTPGHPEVDIKRGIENTSGPLGQGPHLRCGCRYRCQVPESPSGRRNESNYLRIYIRWWYPGRDLTRCRTRCRNTGARQPDHVLRCQQHQLSTTVEEVTS